MTRKGVLPYDAEHLTEPEKVMQKEQERGKCHTCDSLQYRKRSGARVCELQDFHEYTPSDVLSGRVKCDDYLPIKAGFAD